MMNTKAVGWAASGTEGGLGSQKGMWGSSLSPAILRFDKDRGHMGICLLLLIASDCLKHFLTLKNIFAQRQVQPLWTEHGSAAASLFCASARGACSHEETSAPESVPRTLDQTSADFRPQPGLTSRREDPRTSLRTEGNVPIYEAARMS